MNAANDQIAQVEGASPDIAAEKRRELLALFPEARTEGEQIDFDVLRRALGEAVDSGRERYGHTWPGKANCFKTIQAASMATLLPLPAKSVNFFSTKNVVIEGDNLEVLKLLQKSYLSKIKMIYIDPPFNTGNDFIYPDNYSESLETYLEYTGQVDVAGRRFATNAESDGRFHSKWLNMMFPRLYLARNLLTPDGFIFISIDDHEVTNARRLCDEIFGEESFVTQFVWKSRLSEDVRAKSGVSSDHEYVLCYGASPDAALRGVPIDTSKFSNPDSDPRGPWRSADLTGLASKEARPNLHFSLVNPETGIDYGCPPKGWRYERSAMALKISEKRILWPANSEGRPRHKLFLNELRTLFKNQTSIILDHNTAEGTRELASLLGHDGLIPFPKPVDFIKAFLEQVLKEDDIVLDFFAGSGTTAQAVMELNSANGGRRSFILIQLPEPTGKVAYPTIADIAEERLRRVAKQLMGMQTTPESSGENVDLGFRVFSLAKSNIVAWDPDVRHDLDSIENQMALIVRRLRDDRGDLDILFEAVIKEGFPLSVAIVEEKIAGKSVYSIADGAFMICLDRNLNLDLFRAIADRQPERVLLLDEGFADNDQLKVNAAQTFKVRNIVLKTL